MCRWVYYFSRLGLVSLLATLTGKALLSTAKVPHATFHWLCDSCARRAKSSRLRAGILRFLGLFVGLLGLLAAMAAAAALFLLPLSPGDRATVWTWAWVPVAALVLGAALTFVSALPLPGVLGELDRRPFFLEALFRSDPAKLDELRREFPDLYGLGPTPGPFGKSPTFARGADRAT